MGIYYVKDNCIHTLYKQLGLIFFETHPSGFRGERWQKKIFYLSIKQCRHAQVRNYPCHWTTASGLQQTRSK